MFTVRCDPPQPHYGKLGCSTCALAGRKSFIRWVAAPMTPARAAAFRMPFGRYGGQILATIPTDDLVWMRDNIDSNSIHRAVVVHLQDRGVTESE
jgi:hypothetical protein